MGRDYADKVPISSLGLVGLLFKSRIARNFVLMKNAQIEHIQIPFLSLLLVSILLVFLSSLSSKIYFIQQSDIYDRQGFWSTKIFFHLGLASAIVSVRIYTIVATIEEDHHFCHSTNVIVFQKGPHFIQKQENYHVSKFLMTVTMITTIIILTRPPLLPWWELGCHSSEWSSFL